MGEDWLGKVDCFKILGSLQKQLPIKKNFQKRYLLLRQYVSLTKSCFVFRTLDFKLCARKYWIGITHAVINHRNVLSVYNKTTSDKKNVTQFPTTILIQIQMQFAQRRKRVFCRLVVWTHFWSCMVDFSLTFKACIMTTVLCRLY